MNQQNPPQKRPVLLLVICILGFIGLGYSVISSLFQFFIDPKSEASYSLYQSIIEKSMNDMGNLPPETLFFFEKIMNGLLAYLEHMPALILATLICSAIALIGVILMWNYKKIGFVFYSGAKIFLVIFPVIVVGFNFITSIILITGLIFTGAFIAMYAVNLKYMN